MTNLPTNPKPQFAPKSDKNLPKPKKPVDLKKIIGIMGKIILENKKYEQGGLIPNESAQNL